MISDHLKHNTSTVHAFQEALILRLNGEIPSLTKIRYFSDGSSAQYENRFTFRTFARTKMTSDWTATVSFLPPLTEKAPAKAWEGLSRGQLLSSLRRPTTNLITSATVMFKFLNVTFRTTVVFLLASTAEVEKTAEAALQSNGAGQGDARPAQLHAGRH